MIVIIGACLLQKIKAQYNILNNNIYLNDNAKCMINTEVCLLLVILFYCNEWFIVTENRLWTETNRSMWADKFVIEHLYTLLGNALNCVINCLC